MRTCGVGAFPVGICGPQTSQVACWTLWPCDARTVDSPAPYAGSNTTADQGQPARCLVQARLARTRRDLIGGGRRLLGRFRFRPFASRQNGHRRRGALLRAIWSAFGLGKRAIISDRWSRRPTVGPARRRTSFAACNPRGTRGQHHSGQRV